MLHFNTPFGVALYYVHAIPHVHCCPRVPRTVRAAVAGPAFGRVRAAIPLGASACALPRGVSTVRCTPPCCSDNYQDTARWAVDNGGPALPHPCCLTLCRWRLDIIGHSECRRRRCSNGDADGMRFSVAWSEHSACGIAAMRRGALVLKFIYI